MCNFSCKTWKMIIARFEVDVIEAIKRTRNRTWGRVRQSIRPLNGKIVGITE